MYVISIQNYYLQYFTTIFLVKSIPCIYKNELSKIRMSSHNYPLKVDATEIVCVITEYVNYVDPKLGMNITLF